MRRSWVRRSLFLGGALASLTLPSFGLVPAAAGQEGAPGELREGISDQPHQMAVVELERTNGEPVEGSVVLSEGSGGAVLVEADLAGLTPGTHRVIVSDATQCPSGAQRSAEAATREGEAQAAETPAAQATERRRAETVEGRTLGEIEVEGEGVSRYRLLTTRVSLDRRSPESIVGHALVIEPKPDARAGGRAHGSQICGVIRPSSGAPRAAAGKGEGEAPSGPVLSVPEAAEVAGGSTKADLSRGRTEAPRRAAVARLEAASGSPIHGDVVFTQVPGGVLVEADVAGLGPGAHGIHIHETGDCSAPDFKSAGEHFAPAGEPHGGPVAREHHAGDLGNLRAGKNGLVQYRIETDEITLEPGDRSVIGRSVVIHAEPDDYRSQPSGASGARVACGVIRAMD